MSAVSCDPEQQFAESCAFPSMLAAHAERQPEPFVPTSSLGQSGSRSLGQDASVQSALGFKDMGMLKPSTRETVIKSINICVR